MDKEFMVKRGKRPIVPSELLTKDFLSQFKVDPDVSSFLKELLSQVLENYG